MIFPVSFEWATWAASATGIAREYRDDLGGRWQALPVQTVCRRQGLRAGIKLAKQCGAVCFLPSWVQVALALRERMKGLPNRALRRFVGA